MFTDTNGGWTIVGVNNRGGALGATSFGTYMVSWYLNDAFGSFWNAVLQQINAGA